MNVKINIRKSILIIIAALIFALIIYINNNIFITSFEQFIYGIIKIKGSGTSSVIYGFIYVIVSFIITSIILLLPVTDFGKKVIICFKNKYFQLHPIKYIKCYGIILLIFSIIMILHVLGFFSYVENVIFSNTDIFDKYYTESSNVEISFPEERKNLIYIFVESLESSNVSEKNGGLFEETIIPNLENLALENINFSHNDKIGGAYLANGTGWTAAAMIAHTSGIPLKVSIDDFDVNSIKFTNVTTIGDILSQNGYNSYLLLGSDANFAGRRAFFSNHNYLINDYYSAIYQGKIDSDYYEWWGYEDAKLFEYAKEMLTKISNNNKPFNLTMLTADTHFTDGYLDETCSKKFDDAYSNAIYCSDSKISSFVEWIKNQEFYKNTVIVIVGEHYTMQNNFYEDEDYSKRGIYNVFINANIKSEFNSKNRVFTTMDMFPTTLAALGADIEDDRLGLGTNLFSDKKTIPEIIGINNFNEELMKGSHYYYNFIRK